LSDADRGRLGAYVAHFNARDAIRAMTADDVRLDHAFYVIDGAEYLV
jgi:RNA polymerase sigma-70 factor (ECF subfamily)